MYFVPFREDGTAIPAVGPASVDGLSTERGKWLGGVLVWVCMFVYSFPHSKTMHPPIRPRLPWFSRSSRGLLHQRNLSNLPLTINQIFSRQIPPTEAQENEPVTVHGWIKSVRKQKRFAFAEIRDGTTSKPLQAVLSAELARPLVFQFLPWANHLMLSFSPQD